MAGVWKYLSTVSAVSKQNHDGVLTFTVQIYKHFIAT